MALFKAKQRLNTLGEPMKVMPKKLEKRRTTPYVKPIQAATRHGISVGFQRAMQTVVEGVYTNATLLSVVLGYRIFDSLIYNSTLTRNDMRVMVLVGSFNSLQKALMPVYGFGSKSSTNTLDKLVAQGYIHIVLKKPICYALTVRGRDIIQPQWDKFNKLIKETSTTVKRRNSFDIGHTDQEIKISEKQRKREITSLFTNVQTIRVRKPTKRSIKAKIKKIPPPVVWFENPEQL